MQRKCSRTLDKPILMCGMEVEELALLAAVVGTGCLLFEPLIPCLMGICGWFVLMHFKKDKPSGYLLHFIYVQGVDFPGLIPPYKKVERYGAYGCNAI